jgi:hypothetical protein
MLHSGGQDFHNKRTRLGYSGILGIWPPAPPATTTNELVIDRSSSPSRRILIVHKVRAESQLPDRTVVLVQTFWTLSDQQQLSFGGSKQTHTMSNFDAHSRYPSAKSSLGSHS